MSGREEPCQVALDGIHEWGRDPDFEFRREGLICALCGVTEAELAGYDDEDGAS